MQVFQRILVPVDGSKSAEKAIAGAAKIAAVCKSRIDLLYVSYFDGDTDSSVEAVSWLPDTVVGSVAKASEMILGHALEQLPAAIESRAHQKTGVPSKTILQFAEENGNDLIIMGGRGLGIVEGFLLGSVSQYVLEHAKCPVMIIK